MDGVRRHGVLHGNQGVEERIAGLTVSDRASEFLDSNGRFGNVVAQNNIVVGIDEDRSLTTIGDAVSNGKTVVASQINPNEDQGIRDVIGLNFVTLSARVDAELVCGNLVVFNTDIIGLKDQYSGGVKRAVFQ